MRAHLVPTDPAGSLLRCHARGHEAVHDALAAAYPNAKEFALPHSDSETQFFCTQVRLSNISLYRNATSGYSCHANPTDAVRITLPAHGSVVVASKRTSLVAVAGHVGSVCLTELVERKVPSNYMGFHFQVSKRELLSRAHLLTGREYTTDDVATSIGLRTPEGAILYRGVANLFLEVEHLAAIGLGQLARTGINDLIQNLSAVAVVRGVREHLTQGRQYLGDNHAESARQFIDAHAAEPIRISELAAQLGVSCRALQLAFRKRFGCTPLEHLFACRLGLARARLLAPTNMSTVAAVAVDCGFVNLGAFAGRYYRAFGERPSETLKRGLLRAFGRRDSRYHPHPNPLQRGDINLGLPTRSEHSDW
ncbi:MAG: AraC family transcriptional regulator [Rhodospirillales bacterium]|nr:AraC family transcriptional regulator [Rhodospirillales bacterium]